jgi:hypothetical protein
MCSCSFEQTTEDAVKIMQIALQNPEGAIDICAKIQAQSQKQECLFSSALQLQNSPTVREKICQELRNNERGECYFLLAEESNDPTLCPKAIPFENDCRLHIFSLRSGRYHSLSKLIELAKSLDMDINNNNVQALMYREALSRTPNVPISICEQANNSTSCIDVAKKLYRDILILAKKQKNFPCQPPLGRLDHGNHPTLLKEFKVFKQELCIQKP